MLPKHFSNRAKTLVDGKVFRRSEAGPVWYDIRGGSEVHIYLLNHDEVTGTVLVNPSAFGKMTCVQLLNATKLKKNSKIVKQDVYTVYLNEIDILVLTKLYISPPEKFETCMTTFVVKTPKQMENLVLALRGVQEVGVAPHGVKLGRFGTISWLLLNMLDNLVAVDVLGLEEIEKQYAWKMLKEPLFENDKIVKVMHDSRAFADYLYHRYHTTMLTNVFDTQVADLIIKRRNKLIEQSAKNDSGTTKPFNYSMTPLHLSLAQHVPEVITEREICLLMRYMEDGDGNLENGFMKRPTPEAKHCKFAALTVKYLLILKTKLMCHFTNKLVACCKINIQQTIERDLGDSQRQAENPRQVPEKLAAELELPPSVVPIQDEKEIVTEILSKEERKMDVID